MISSDRITEIERRANTALKQFYGSVSLGTPLPIDIYSLAKQRDIDVYEVVFNDRDISGAFDGKKIQVASTDSFTQKAFTIAHEIGHHDLHFEKFHNGIEVLYRSDIDDPLIIDSVEEAEANAFGSAILMPRNIVSYFDKKGMGVQRMSEVFGVTPAAMNYRLLNMPSLIVEQ